MATPALYALSYAAVKRQEWKKRLTLNRKSGKGGRKRLPSLLSSLKGKHEILYMRTYNLQWQRKWKGRKEDVEKMMKLWKHGRRGGQATRQWTYLSQLGSNRGHLSRQTSSLQTMCGKTKRQGLFLSSWHSALFLHARFLPARACCLFMLLHARIASQMVHAILVELFCPFSPHSYTWQHMACVFMLFLFVPFCHAFCHATVDHFGSMHVLPRNTPLCLTY